MTEVGSSTLLTVLGTTPKDVLYRLGDRTCRASFAAVALAQLLPEQPRRVIAICTPEAEREQLPRLQAAMPGGIVVEELPMAVSGGERHLPGIVESIGNRIDGEPSVVVDLTNGLRHVAVLTFAAAVLVSALRRSEVRGVYYARVEDGEFIDLRHLIRVLDLSYAARSFEATGSANALAGLLEEATDQASRASRKALRTFSEARLAGLPLEQGKAATDVLQCVERLTHALTASGLPMAKAITETVRATVEAVRLPAIRTGDGWKRSLVLDEIELERQRRIIDERLRLRAWSTALLMMEEWLVSWTIWRAGDAAAWLEKDRRARASYELHALRKVLADEPSRLRPEQQRLAQLWDRLSEARNAFAHAGMRPQEVNAAAGQLASHLNTVLGEWQWIVENPDVSVSTPGMGPVMVSPLGKLPGALFTALLKHPQIDRCLVVCSGETRSSLDAIAERLGRPVAFEPLLLEDPFAGVDELLAIIKQARPRLLDASEVYVHLTGGSTLMAHACERIADTARRYGRPVHYFLSLDRRGRAAQEREPFVVGEILPLEDPSEGGA